MFKKITLFTLLISTTFLAYCLMQKKNYIPLKVLLGNPTITNPQISPDGTKLAYVKPSSNNVLNICVKDLASNEETFITFDNNQGISSYCWRQDNQHVFYVQDNEGDENSHIYMTNIATKTTQDLTPYPNVKARIIAHNHFHPSELAFSMNKENPILIDMYKINLDTLETTLIEKNWGTVFLGNWHVDYDLDVRGAIDSRSDGSFIVAIKDADGNWNEEMHLSVDDSFNTGVSHFAIDKDIAYILDSRNDDKGVLTTYNLKTKEQTVIAANPDAEIQNIFVDKDTMEILAVEFYKNTSEWQVLNPDYQADFDTLAQLHRGEFNIVNRTNDQQKWIVEYSSDTHGVVWYLYNRTTKTGEQLFYSQPELLQYELQPMEPVTFKARDGLEVNGYITYPADYQEKQSPLVLWVHGGPWHRDKWGYNPIVQLFANRGYACLQINYRGSTGFGKDFLNAGNKQWGQKMHTDLIDGAEYIKATGYIDTDKIAITGASYGGYAALAGATLTPDYFTCAVDIFGISNLVTLMNSFPPYWKVGIENYYRRVGNPNTEAEFLESISPFTYADQIKIPMLIEQGANDVRVPQEESEQIVAALKKHNIPHEYVVFEDEGHGFQKPQNRLKFFGILEKFLEKHLGN